MEARANPVIRAFINPEQELRSGWRALAFVLSAIIAVVLIRGLIGGLGGLIPALGGLLSLPSLSNAQPGQVVAYELLSFGSDLVAVILATVLCAQLLERRSFSSVGFYFRKGWFQDCTLGSVLGVLSLSACIAIELATGAARFEIQTRGIGQFALAAVPMFLIYLAAAAFEELFFRGFAFQALLHNLGPIWALSITSFIFGAAHLFNGGATLFSTVNTVLAGVWLGVAYLKTRDLWLCTALHCFWNFAMGFIFGLPVSGITDLTRFAWLKGQDGSPQWMSGGTYGPEGGAAVTIVLLVSTAIIWKIRMFKPSPEVIEALKHRRKEPRFVSITGS